MAFMTPLKALLIDHACHIIIPLLVPLFVLPLSLINATFPAVDNFSSFRDGLDQRCNDAVKNEYIFA